MTKAMPFRKKQYYFLMTPAHYRRGDSILRMVYGYFSKISRMEAENAETPIPDGLILFSAST